VPAKFRIVSVSPEVVETTVNTTFRLLVQVVNEGDEPGPWGVVVKAPTGFVMGSAEKLVDVPPGAADSVFVDVSAPTVEGTFTYTVEVVNLATNAVDDTATVTVTTERLPKFYIVSIDAPSEVPAGYRFAVTVKIVNRGLGSGRARVCVGAIACADVSADPDQYVDVVLVVTAPSAPGTTTYRVTVTNLETGEVDDSKYFSVTVVAVERTVVAEATVTVTGGTPPIDVEVSVSVDGDVQKCVETVGSVPSTVVCRKSWRVPVGTWTVRAEAVLSNRFGTVKLGPVSRSVTVT